MVICSYRIYEDDIAEPGMMGSTAINRCVALSEFDVSDAHIANHSASAAAAAGPASSSEHLPSDQSLVVYTFSVINCCMVFNVLQSYCAVRTFWTSVCLSCAGIVSYVRCTYDT